jgi:hypothetical protein
MNMLRKIEVGWRRREWLESLRLSDSEETLSGTAVISYGPALNLADVLHAFREVGEGEDTHGDDESVTMERLRDGLVKLGAVRYEHYAGSQRRIVN